MKNILFIYLVFLLSCVVMKENPNQSNVRKMTFSVHSVYDNNSEKSQQLASFLGKLDSIRESDDLNVKLAQMMTKQIELESTFPNEIYIEPTEDGWIRQRFVKNKYTNYVVYFSKSDSADVLDPTDRTRVGSYKIQRDSCTYLLEEDKSRTKNILGYICHYVKVEESYGNPEFTEIMGNQIYEMWVTNKIQLPMYALLNNECLIHGFFPLEATKYQSKSKENYHKYVLEKME